MTSVACHIMLGGLFGPDGLIPLVNTGMYWLRDQLRAIPGVTADTRTWPYWRDLEPIIAADHMNGAKIAVIGYSGGGSRATWLASEMFHKPSPTRLIDLVVGYDPSPARQCYVFGDNVQQAICYFNEAPWMFGYGGGRYEALSPNVTKITTVTIRQQHMLVQYNQNLHNQTIAAVRALQ